MTWLTLDHRGQRLARGTLHHGDRDGAANERGGDDRSQASPAPTRPRPPMPPGRGPGGGGAILGDRIGDRADGADQAAQDRGQHGPGGGGDDSGQVRAEGFRLGFGLGLLV
jgi:hypothetical protein